MDVIFANQDIFEDKELKKLINKFGSMFVDEILRLDRGGLEFKMAELVKHNHALEEFPKTKPEIKEAKAAYDELMAPFREQKRENKAKTKLIAKIFEAKFGEERE